MTSRIDITGRQYRALQQHLFQHDHDEHGAIILAGVRECPGHTVLLAREIHPLAEHDFGPGERGYRQFTPGVLARLASRAAEQRLALVTCHSHPGAGGSVGLSRDDLNGHRRVFPHLLDILHGPPVAGLAFGLDSVAGELWTSQQEPTAIERVRIHGNQLRELTARPSSTRTRATAERFDRQVRMFGSAGQAALHNITTGVVGLGGGGSMIVEQLAHLGVGTIVGIDFDVVQPHNLSRIVGARPRDANKRQKKVQVARRLVHQIDPNVHFKAVDGDIADTEVAHELTGCDFLFLATDTITSRLVANAISHAHHIPLVQVGAKVDLGADRDIESVYVAVRPVIGGRGCLNCAGLIDPLALQRENATGAERRAQNYLGLPEIIDPSVITLNGIAASMATNLMLMYTVGMSDEELLAHRLLDARTGRWLTLASQTEHQCVWCGTEPRSRFARGDSADLPTRSEGQGLDSTSALKRGWDRIRRPRTRHRA